MSIGRRFPVLFGLWTFCDLASDNLRRTFLARVFLAIGAIGEVKVGHFQSRCPLSEYDPNWQFRFANQAMLRNHAFGNGVAADCSMYRM
jgi:hypothetical protein